MAQAKASIVITAEDRASYVLKEIQKSTQGFSTSISNLVRQTAGIAGVSLSFYGLYRGLSSCVTAAMYQEKVESDLAASLKVTGDYTSQLMTKYKQFASSIQDVTTYGDEQVLSLMQYAHSLGVSSDKIEQTTKMALGLAQALRIDEQTAIKMVSGALRGQYELFTRYIPAIKNAKSESEKYALVQELVNKGFAEMKVDTATEALKQLNNDWSDLKELLGEALLPLLKEFASWLHENKDEIAADMKYIFGPFEAVALAIQWAKVAKEAEAREEQVRETYRRMTGDVKAFTQTMEGTGWGAHFEYHEPKQPAFYEYLKTHPGEIKPVVPPESPWVKGFKAQNELIQEAIMSLRIQKALQDSIRDAAVLPPPHTEETVNYVTNIDRAHSGLNETRKAEEEQRQRCLKSELEEIALNADLSNQIDLETSGVRNLTQARLEEESGAENQQKAWEKAYETVDKMNESLNAQRASLLGVGDEYQRNEKVLDFYNAVLVKFNGNYDIAIKETNQYRDRLEALDKLHKNITASQGRINEALRQDSLTRQEKIQIVEQEIAKLRELGVANEELIKQEQILADLRRSSWTTYTEELRDTATYTTDQWTSAIQSCESATSLMFQNMTAEGMSFKDAMRSFAIDILKAFNKMASDIAARELFAALFQAPNPQGQNAGLLGSIIGGIGGLFTGGAGAWGTTAGQLGYNPTMHTGGVAGYGGFPQRLVSPIDFVGAQRYHLGSDEVPAILQKGEIVLPKGMKVGGGGGAGGPGEWNAIAAHTGGEIGYGEFPQRLVSPIEFVGAPRYHIGSDEVPSILQKGESVFPIELIHTGGTAGYGGFPQRLVSPIEFAGAPRYHIGSDEVPAILQKGESVFPKGTKFGQSAVKVEVNNYGQSKTAKVDTFQNPNEQIIRVVLDDFYSGGKTYKAFGK